MNGTLDTIIMDGRETINEAVDIRSLGVVGNIVFNRKVDAQEVEISGKAQFGSVITCDKLTVTGECSAKIDVITQQIKVKHGRFAFYGKVYTDSLLSSGEVISYDVIRSHRINLTKEAKMVASGTVKAGIVKVFGKIVSTTYLKSTELRIVSNQMSEIRSIITDILLTKKTEDSNERRKSYVLTSDFVDCIEADLSCCQIGQLYCDSAIIRSGCVIDELVYMKEVEIEPGAVVERLVKA